jgi:two-component system, NtrC family, sensor kinase
MNLLLPPATSLKSRIQSRINRSLTLKTLAWMGLPVVGISCIMIALFYQYNLQQTEGKVRQSLIQNVEARSKRDSEIFQLAQTNHSIVKRHLLEKLLTPDRAERQAREAQFDRTVTKWSDGTFRNAPQTQDFKTFPALQQATVFIGNQVTVTPEIKQQVMLFQEFSTRYGRAFASRFNNTWINGAQNISADYRPDNLWGLEAPVTTNIPNEEYGYLADKAHNRDRKSLWTSLYFDPIPQRWMVSIVTPVDDAKGNHVGTIGNDLILNDLMEYAVRDTFPGSYNLIFRQDGQLIVHPSRMVEIQEKQGKLKLQDTQDPLLQHIFQHAQQFQKATLIGKDPQRQFLWATTQLKGPDWYLVTVYPQGAITQAALQDITPMLVFGLIALLTEVFLLYRVLRHQVHQPLAKLSAATEAVSRGDFDVALDRDREDEVGRLARSFTSMAEQLQASFYQLSLHNDQLETQVKIRTQELETTLTDLQLTQSQLLHSEKLSSLGQMVAGIAHEVNNPIGFIDGNLKHAARYMLDLLDHIQLYESQTFPPEVMESIADHAEHIDLEFIQQDLPKLLTSMQMGTDRIRNIVVSLRNFSRLDSTQIQETNLHDGIDSTLIILHHRLMENPGNPIQVTKNYASLPLVQCYSGLINQVFMNLISNAIDALATTPNPQITIQTAFQDDEVTITIADNGPGIPESAQSQIFDSFFTTKALGKGTGLGLSISHQIMTERHQGTIVCDSHPNQGTRFILKLPRLYSEVQMPLEI